MKQFLAACLLLISIGCGVKSPIAVLPTVPTTPTLTATEIVLQSIVRVTIDAGLAGTYTCTGFSIAPRKFYTAEHCTAPLQDNPGTLKVNGIPAFVISESEELDLAVIVADLDMPALTIRPEALQMYEAVQAAGFGYGFTRALVTSHSVMLLEYVLDADIYKGTIFLNGFIGGMSGGPVFDKNGQVVGMVQRGTENIGYGVSTATMIEFLGRKQ